MFDCLFLNVDSYFSLIVWCSHLPIKKRLCWNVIHGNFQWLNSFNNFLAKRYVRGPLIMLAVAESCITVLLPGAADATCHMEVSYIPYV